jgi:tagatose 1,6-diphosphate aldolase
MPRALSAGKLRNLATLCDEAGIFKMMAIDQRGSLEESLGKALGREPGFDRVARFKQLVIRELAPYSTAVLTDPIYGYARSVRDIPGSVGLLLAYEKTGYAKSTEGGHGRKTELIEGWSVAKARRAGATAIKLLLYYHPDAEAEVVEHQKETCRKVGAECAEHDLPFLLETVAYPLEEPGTDSVEFARRKPDLVRRSAEEFSKPEYGVDVLKLEFPGDLKFTREYRSGAFDGKVREEAYTEKDLARACQELNDASRLPWVILSAGVEIGEFVRQVDLACEAGASGFLCGRAIWKDAVPLLKNEEEMVEFLGHTAVINFLKCNAAAEAATPVWDHPSMEGVMVSKDTPDWHRKF